MKKTGLSLLAFLLVFSFVCTADSARIKDLADLQGVRDNQILGYGLVVGLNDTGDSSNNGVTMETVANMMEHMGLTLNRDEVDVGNVAAVMVTANLPPFAKSGTETDVVVSSIGDAESLSGGILLRTPLAGPDQEVYAVAQGSVVVGGASVDGTAASVEKNHPTVGRIPDGALVEREVDFELSGQGPYEFNLRDGDFTTISRMADTVNSTFGQDIAEPVDSTTLEVSIPENYRSGAIRFLSELENLRVQPDEKARIVVNERTGTIVMGSRVRLSTVAVSHGNIKLTVKESPGVSQPAPFSTEGETVVVPDTEVEIEEEEAGFVVMEEGVSVGDVAAALNIIGVSPRDVIAIFQAVKAAGALQAELVVL
ncbi:MAG: flagellar basal body P-ring protein FlgI [Desulfobacterales bacterium]